MGEPALKLLEPGALRAESPARPPSERSHAGFLFLAAIATAAFGILYFFMPETREKSFLSEYP